MNGELKKNFGSLKRRPFLTPLWLTVISGLIVVSFAAWFWISLDATTVIVIRHAEKLLDGSADPPLAAAGEARAVLLANLFGDPKSPGHIDSIYVSPTRRSQLTAAPLASRLSLMPRVEAQDNPQALARRVLRDNRGARVLIVGHSDTAPVIVAALTGRRDIPAMAAEEYGTMYIVTVPRLGPAMLLRLNY